MNTKRYDTGTMFKVLAMDGTVTYAKITATHEALECCDLVECDKYGKRITKGCRANGTGFVGIADLENMGYYTQVQKQPVFKLDKTGCNVLCGKVIVGRSYVKPKGGREVKVLQGMPRVETYAAIMGQLPQYAKENQMKESCYPDIFSR